MEANDEDLVVFTNEKHVADNTLSVIEGYIDSENSLHARGKVIRSRDLADYIEDPYGYGDIEEPPHSCRFRVLSIPRLQHGLHKIGMPKQTYNMIKRKWGLHDLTAEVFTNNNGVISSFDTSAIQCILMKVAASRSTGFDCVSISHDRNKSLTNVLYYGLADENGLFETLLARPDRCLDPAFFATVLYRSHQRRVEQFRKRIDVEVHGTEMDTKFGGPGRLFGHRYAHEEATVKIDTDKMTRKLSFLQTELAVAGHVARCCINIGECLVGLVKKDDEEWIRVRRTKSADEVVVESRKLAAENTRKTLDETEYVKRRAVSLLSQLQALSDRVQSQTTFLINTATQEQSKYTATIALETRRDSAAMKTIAILTILFLPGTFVATLFSMDMFEWQPDDGGSKPKVSKWIWLYWGISISLTLMVMAGWLVWTKRSVNRLIVGERMKEAEDGKLD